jgi:hypothetical protein
MLLRFKYTRPLYVKVHAASYAEAYAAIQATLRDSPSTLRAGPWELDASDCVAQEEVEVLPTDFVVHQGRVVRANTIDTKTLPMPWAEPER